MTTSIRRSKIDISQQDKESFWDFVRINRSCGAFDDESSFEHFKQVYSEYEDYLNDIDNLSVTTVRNFRALLEEARDTLEIHALHVRESPEESHLFSVFQDVDIWLDKFPEVAAFRRMIDLQIMKQILSPLS
jgi:hypothetical protein